MMNLASRISVLALLLSAGSVALADPPGGFLRNGVTAHRGNAAEHPENTIPAFRSAIGLGADWVELDVLLTKDGKLVVSHDRTTGGVGDKDLVVPESTYAELRDVDVAAGFRRSHHKSLAECPRHTMPLLEDVLRLMMTQNRTRVSIQPKTDCVAEVAALVKQLGAEKWVGFNDTNPSFMARAKQLLPESTVFWDRVETNIREDTRRAREHGFDALVLRADQVNDERVRVIHEAGLEAGAWTVNDADAMKRLLDLGVDRMYTDYPARLLALQSERLEYAAVQCEGTFSNHLQGICVDDKGSVYWSFTDTLVKSDVTGKALKQVAVAFHHGDLCYDQGKLYVAVNLGKFNDPRGGADSWVYMYDAESLSEVARHKLPEPFYGAGGIGVRNDSFMVVGGLPPGVDENYVYEYDRDFQFVRKHVIQSGYTLMGIQTAGFFNGFWWFGCYGEPRILLKTDENFQLLSRVEFDCALGLAGLPDGRFLVGRGKRLPGKMNVGSVVIAHSDPAQGLVVAPEGKQD